MAHPARAALLALAGLIFAATRACAVDVTPLWNFADPAASEQAFRGALAAATNADDVLVLQTQIARTYSLRSRFADAHALLDAIEPALPTAGAEPRVRALLERGRTWRSSSSPERARPLFEEAAALAETTALDALRVDAVHMLALVETDPARQLAFNERALAIALASAEPTARRWEASLANNIGMSLHDAGRHDDALAAFRRALAAREHMAAGADAMRGARWMVAWALRPLGRHDEALAILRALEQETAALGVPDGFVFEEIAENLLASGHAEAARPMFARAFALHSGDTSLERPDAARLSRLERLSR
ncbi:MAG: tetratricopeptide repeat protein [Caldimonas sp.]